MGQTQQPQQEMRNSGNVRCLTNWKPATSSYAEVTAENDIWSTHYMHTGLAGRKGYQVATPQGGRTWMKVLLLLCLP